MISPANGAGALQIRTPEGVTFALVLASPVTRFLAWLVDLGLTLAAGFLVSLGFALVAVLDPDLAQALMAIGWFVMRLGYSIAFEWWWRGQTPGKRLLGLRVMDAEGFRLSLSQVVVRNLLRFVDFLPGLYLVGGTAACVSRRLQRLGDQAANTVVVRHPRVREPDWASLESGKYNSMAKLAHLGARLRQRASPEAAQLALQTLLRRETLEPAERLEVFREAAGYFRTLVAWPPDVVDGLSDEQFLRNVVELLFRPTGGNVRTR